MDERAHGPRTRRAILVAGAAALLAGGCAAAAPSGIAVLPAPSFHVAEGLAPCGAAGATGAWIDGDRPVVVAVHGKADSPLRFAALADALADRDAQTVCFHYDARRRVDPAARRLRGALASLRAQLDPGVTVTVLGHSLGGLVARRALVRDLPGARPARLRGPLRLVTAATPFAGVKAARDCGRDWLHVLSFGATAVVCQFVAGDSWHDIHPNADLIRRPGRLDPAVARVLQVRTVERGACQRQRDDGTCLRDDFVFTLEEQQSAVVDADPRVDVAVVRSGHVQIVDDRGAPPRKLLTALERAGVLPAAKGVAARGDARVADR